MSVDGAYRMLAGRLDGSIRRGEPLSRRTSYRIGGPADLFVICDSISDLAQTVRACEAESVPLVVLGKGTNVLVADDGYRGAVAVLGKDFKRHGIEGEHMRVGAGVILAAVVQEAFAKGLTGLEFAVGVPGTVGGALVMNAGSRDAWIGGIVESVTLLVPGQGLVALRGSEIAWAYRETDLPSRGVVVECALKVQPGDKDAIRRVMEAALTRRKATQPMGAACAGSVFVNPPGDSAGRLIEAAGLKGARVGGAAVSDVHANFIVNDGTATAADVLSLIELIRTAVRDEYGIGLQTEIRFLGDFGQA